MAGQLKSGTTLGAANNIAMVSPILTISHKKNPATAAPGFIEDTLLINPRANNAPGTTTASAPYNTDQPTRLSPLSTQATHAANVPITSCPVSTHHGDVEGWASLSFCASSRVRGLKLSFRHSSSTAIPKNLAGG